VITLLESAADARNDVVVEVVVAGSYVRGNQAINHVASPETPSPTATAGDPDLRRELSYRRPDWLRRRRVSHCIEATPARAPNAKMPSSQ
jgi:hypothetical protein